MARIRTIKPDFWTDEKVVELDVWTRLLFIGLWNFADDDGRMVASARRIKMQIFPADDVDIRRGLDELADSDLIELYSIDGMEYLQVRNFSKHQKIDRRTPSKLPQKPQALAESSPNSPDGREGKGKDLKTLHPQPLPRTDTAPADQPPAGVVCEKTPDPQVVAHVDRLRVTAAVGTDAHARAGELHAICSANQVKATASHPLLVDWAREGVTPAHLTRAITEARKSNAGPLNPAYLEPILERVRNGTIDAKPAPAPLAASHSTEKAAKTLQEARQARETAAPMPDHVRDLIARLKPEF